MNLVEVECQNCRKKMEIEVPYIGCPFCGECMSTDTNYVHREDRLFGENIKEAYEVLKDLFSSWKK